MAAGWVFIIGLLLGVVIGLAIAGGSVHASPRSAAWSSMPCATDVSRDFIRYTCRIEEN